MFKIITLIIAVAVLIFLISSVFISLNENEKHAAYRLLSLSVIFSLLLSVPFIFHFSEFYFAVLSGIFILIILLLIIPVKGKLHKTETPKTQIDERNIMFSRAELIPETERFINYYSEHPENLEKDNKFRKNSGLLQAGTAKYNSLLFALADASFYTVESFKYRVDGKLSETKIPVSPEKITEFIKKYMEFSGAKACGVTELKKYHLYSYGGRGGAYGKKLTNTHKFAIAITVEMSKKMTDTAPAAPTVTESARQYLEVGKLAVQLAAFIRNTGYSARAHIDGNYEVICPLVAKDAGLGEIGRMGLLMTPELGPRVRIAVVTTSLEMIPDNQFQENSVIDFCIQCKKCAVTCPSQAISFSDREKINEVIRWQINQEACYTYWTKSGTDCSKCLQVCPYSHPNNFLHNIVRKGIKNSVIFRKFALTGDDFLYGKKPKAKAFPEFMKIDVNN
ncbi:MAG: 4Fe-4S dicluster domain-containing protein [Bacteroidales bacterium]|nr:4Fe-4S dicluster domain-containing protein [Bacteroidales bacterium]